MTRTRMIPALLLPLLVAPALARDEPPPEAEKAATVSFLKDVAPILVENCIACHNARKSEGKYNMVTFAALARGGPIGEGMNLVAGDPEGSYFVELMRPDAEPRMPYKLDALPAEKVALIESWVREGAAFDGADPEADWTALLHKIAVVEVPESYPVAVPITALAFAPAGDRLISSGYHELIAWKVEDGALADRTRGLAERVYDVVYSPDGHWLATASGDPGRFGAARLWKVGDGGAFEPARELFDTNDSVYAVAFSPDGTLVAAAGADRTIRTFRVESGEPVASIEDHADWIFDLAFSPDGKRLASASRDKTAKVFDVEKKESLVTFPGHNEAVYAVAFSADGTQVITSGGDNQVRFWSPDEDGKQVRNVGGFGGAIFALRLTPDGSKLLACSADKTVKVLNPADGNVLHNLQGHADWVYALAVSADGKTAASGSWDGEVRLWNLEDGQPVRTILAAPGLAPPPAEAP